MPTGAVGQNGGGGERAESKPTATAEPKRLTHLGRLICAGQTVDYSFAIVNETSRPMRLSRAAVLVPCCSAVGPYPEVIAPDQTASIPTQLNTGIKTGPKRVEFVVRTDDPAAPLWRLELTADLVARQEVVPSAAGSWVMLTARTPGRWLWRAVTRHPVAARPSLPASVSLGDPLRARLVGTPRIGPAEEGVVEVAQEIEVIAPPSTTFGQHTDLLRVLFDDRSTALAPITWAVDDPISIAPSGLILGRSDGVAVRSFVLQSVGDPVGIVGIASDLLARPYSPTGEVVDRSGSTWNSTRVGGAAAPRSRSRSGSRGRPLGMSPSAP